MASLVCLERRIDLRFLRLTSPAHEQLHRRSRVPELTLQCRSHRMMGTMVISRIQDRFGVVLTLRTLFESPAALALAEALRRTRQTAQAVSIEITVLDERREEFEI